MNHGEIIRNRNLQGDYFQVEFFAPEIAVKAMAGQFTHVKIAALRDRILRRPFSINATDPEAGTVTVTYKIVGQGTEVLATLTPGMVCDLMGPLGNGFSAPVEDEIPVLLTGGYGVAATYLLTRSATRPGILLAGARTEADLILLDDYRASGFDVRAATNDGSAGIKGFVTDLLPQVLTEYAGMKLKFYACGPGPMLQALARILPEHGYPDAELSLDHLMCCGVGACFACVVKIKADNADGWRYARSCSEGPVFHASQIYLD